MDDCVTKCPICMETLQTPRSISCSHTFCQKCLNDHIITSCHGKDSPTGFHCPVCRKYVPGSISNNPSLWAKTFPKNETIEFLIHSADDENVLKFCKPCLNGNKEETASTLCKSCMECLCEGCTDHHKRLTITKDHEVVPLDEIHKPSYLETEEHNCNEHNLRYLDLFCFDHDTPCCSVCSITDHKTCKMDTIKTVFDKIEKENESQQMLSEICRAESHLKKLKEIQKEKQTKIEDKADEIRDETNKLRQEINETLDRLEHKLHENLAKNMKLTQKAIDENMETLSDLLNLSNHCKEFLTSATKRTCSPGYVGEFHKIKKQLKRLRSAKLYIKDAEISATFPNFLKTIRSSKQSASLTVKENPISLINLEFQSVPKGVVKVEKNVLDILKDDAAINDILFYENNTDILVFVDDKTGVVCDLSGVCHKSVDFRFTILRAVLIRKKIYAVTDKGNLYYLEIPQNNTTCKCTKINITFAVSVFQESLVVGCVNAIVHMDTNGNERKNIPTEGC
nr:tripartite motif-containing protein 45-like [Crassostrea gigas]